MNPVIAAWRLWRALIEWSAWIVRAFAASPQREEILETNASDAYRMSALFKIRLKAERLQSAIFRYRCHKIYEIFGLPLMPRRAALLTIGVIVLSAVLAAIYWSREESCHRMLQTVELAQGSEVRAAIFGGCHIVGPEEASESHHR